MNSKTTARERALEGIVGEQRKRIESLNESREDADRRANYYWHLYLDGVNQLDKQKKARAADNMQAMKSEDELGRHLDALQRAAELMYQAYNGLELEFEEYCDAERVILLSWDEFQNEGTDVEQAEPIEPKQWELPF